MDDMTRPVELDSKKLRVLPEHAVEDFLPEVGDGRKADVVDEVVAEVIAQALDQERGQNRDRHHGPDIVDAGRQEVLKIDGVIETGDGEQRHQRIGRIGF